MEDGLRDGYHHHNYSSSRSVLILVLMEDGLRVANVKKVVALGAAVLILVLMEDGLREDMPDSMLIISVS